MATGYIRVCRSPPWCQSFDLGPYAWTWSGLRWYGSPSGETEPLASRSSEAEFRPRGRARRSANPRLGRGGAQTQGSGEAKPALRGRARWSPWPWCRARWSQPSGVGRGRVLPQRLGEAEPTLRGRARRSPRPRCWVRRSQPLGSGEVESALRGRVRWSQPLEVG